MNLFDELKRDSLVMAYAHTGNERFLKDLPASGFNEPTHLPQPLPEPDPLVFDIFDDVLMRDCIGGRLTKPVQALIQAYEVQWDHYTKDDIKALVKDLRDAVKDEFGDL